MKAIKYLFSAFVLLVIIGVVSENNQNQADKYVNQQKAQIKNFVAAKIDWRNNFNGKVAYRYYYSRVYNNCIKNGYGQSTCDKEAVKRVTAYLDQNWHPNYQLN